MRFASNRFRDVSEKGNLMHQNRTHRTLQWAAALAGAALVAVSAAVLSGCAAFSGAYAAEPKATTLISSVATHPPVQIFAGQSLEFTRGETGSLQEYYSADFLPQNPVVFASSNEDVAVVDEAGRITAVREGETVVTAVCGTATGELSITVSEPAVPPGLHIVQDYLSLAQGESAALECVLEGGASGTVTYTSSDPDVAAVDAGGSVTAAGTGTARITASTGDYSDTVSVWATETAPEVPSGIAPARYALEEGILINDSAEPSRSATIFLTGDLMALSSQQSAAYSGGSYSYDSSFSLVQPIFAEGDFVMGNLETNVSRSNPTTAQEKNVQGNPNCNTQPAYLEALRHAGYDAVATANNHSGDTGVLGMYETIEMLDAYDIAHTGTFTKDSEPRYLLADINGVRVAFLSYTEILNTKYGELALPDSLRPQLLGNYSAENVQRDAAAARAAGAEYVIAYNHWGMENTHEVTEKQLQHAQEMADAGVDFIAGSHSHCLQPAQIIKAADGREVPCIFSLGNFVSSMGRDINNDTVIVQINIEKTGDGLAVTSGYIPCRVHSGYGDGRYVIVPAEAGSAVSGRIEGVVGTQAMRNLRAS